MSTSYLHLLTPVFGLLINVILQLLICRYVDRIGLLKSVFAGFFLGFLAVIILEIRFYLGTMPDLSEVSGQLLLHIITYSALGYCYFHFVNLGETARRIRIVRELYESGDGLTKDDLNCRYTASGIVHARLQRMVGSRQIILEKGKYTIGKPVLLYMAKTIVFMKLILLGKRSEFD